tara:strand:+ start:3002 stop:3865 length:864 start_codon:yes stop_codon:yes gene_type:complete
MPPESVKKGHSEEEYIKLGQWAKSYNYGGILDELIEYFGYLHDKDDMDNVGLKLQICVKKSRPMYIHGYVLTSALYYKLSSTEIKSELVNSNFTNRLKQSFFEVFTNKQIKDEEKDEDFIILETGTARGFSSIMMAKMLEMFNVNGKIYTTDKINMFDNCIKSAQLNRNVSIHECVEEWKPLVDKYINFVVGNTKITLPSLNEKLNRIHFAFLDGSHHYKDIKYELDYVAQKQQQGDIIVCDDYTRSQFPGIYNAVNEFLEKGLYDSKKFFGSDGRKHRGYVYMIKK